MSRKTPQIIEVNSRQMEELLDRAASNTLRAEDAQLLRQILDSYRQLFQIVGDKNTSISRLRKLLFGASSEKTDKVVAEERGAEDPQAAGSDADRADSEAQNRPAPGKESPPGHGRYGADDYPGAKQVDIAHPWLCVGDDCPRCHAGTLYEKTPSVFVRFSPDLRSACSHRWRMTSIGYIRP